MLSSNNSPRYLHPPPRPISYNSWFATFFDVRADQQVELAWTAKQIGVELFAMDDGWFHGRKDDHGGLGHRWPDPDKFPAGPHP